MFGGWTFGASAGGGPGSREAHLAQLFQKSLVQGHTPLRAARLVEEAKAVLDLRDEWQRDPAQKSFGVWASDTLEHGAGARPGESALDYSGRIQALHRIRMMVGFTGDVGGDLTPGVSVREPPTGVTPPSNPGGARPPDGAREESVSSLPRAAPSHMGARIPLREPRPGAAPGPSAGHPPVSGGGLPGPSGEPLGETVGGLSVETIAEIQRAAVAAAGGAYAALHGGPGRGGGGRLNVQPELDLDSVVSHRPVIQWPVIEDQDLDPQAGFDEFRLACKCYGRGRGIPPMEMIYMLGMTLRGSRYTLYDILRKRYLKNGRLPGDAATVFDEIEAACCSTIKETPLEKDPGRAGLQRALHGSPPVLRIPHPMAEDPLEHGGRRGRDPGAGCPL